ncbi:MAG TPA: AAA family ATPase [Vicinamibacterales bacterium]|nr:AAA family ATPase [Vicinamibacterales bacterium]
MQPLPSLDALADPIYEAFYGLKEQPFAITTDPRFFYLSTSHQRAFTELQSGLRRREGLLLLTGETGTGKTTLCRAVVESLGDRTFAAMVLNPYMAGAEIFRVILRDFGLVSHEELRRGTLATADTPRLLDMLEGFLASLLPLSAHAVVIVDEAQSLSAQVLDQIRMLTALEHNGQRLAQIVLCGQPALLNTLKAEPIFALNERITRRVALAPLSPDEVEAYIQHRLEVAGGTDAVRFPPESTKLIAELSRGVPRRINVLCDRALQEGRVDGAMSIGTDLVKRAAKALAGVYEKPGVLVAPSAPRTPIERTPVPIEHTPHPPAFIAEVPAAAPDPVKALGLRLRGEEAPALAAAASADFEMRPEVLTPTPSALPPRSEPAPTPLFEPMPDRQAARPRMRMLGLVVSAATIVVLGGYGWFARGVLATDAGLPELPAAPPLPVAAAKALPPPTEDQVKIILYEMLVGSDQIPRNRDEFH